MRNNILLGIVSGIITFSVTANAYAEKKHDYEARKERLIQKIVLYEKIAMQNTKIPSPTEEINTSSQLRKITQEPEKRSVTKEDSQSIKITPAKQKDNIPPDEFMIKELEFKDALLVDVIRVISELSGINIVATADAAEKPVTIYLRDVSVKHAVETICRINNLWYRQDKKSKTFRILTTEEYSNDLVVHRDDETKVFTLRNPNVELIANAIEDLYGDRVERRQSGGNNTPQGFGNNGSSFGGGSNNRFNSVSNNSFFNDRRNRNNGESGGSTINRDREIDEKLSIDQIAALDASGRGGNQISVDQLQAVSAQETTIYLTTNFEHNLVLIRSSDKEALDSIAVLVEELDRPVPQVMLEMKIIDVLVGDDFNSIFNVEVAGDKLSDSTNPTLIGNNALGGGGSFIFEFLNDKVLANIELLEQRNRVNVLSTPMILASNNRPARLFVGEERVLVTGYSSTSNNSTQIDNNLITSDITENIVPDTEVEEIGNTIEIIPFINADGTITLNIQQESSTVRVGGANIPVVSEGNVLNLPTDTVNTARLQGTIIAKDNFSIAVGGLIRTTFSDNERRLPFARLLTGKTESEEKSELILMITPHIIKEPHKQDDLLPDFHADTLTSELSDYSCYESCKK